ncbi:hypothetical protein LYNGBM3L_61010 [Moorena producens 3L]|uniref:Uncharacterized protein n=1 Tax=Moorena producens 3L TaxID=489825 RepID=F4Y0B2_9CYAN|nr:hypothetical protein LYNGBM3L_61010 [Moorena producens 3L]
MLKKEANGVILPGVSYSHLVKALVIPGKTRKLSS